VGGQSALVGEYGPEIIHFPQPGYVYNTEQTAQMLQSLSEGKGGDTHQHISITIVAKDVDSFRRSKDQVMAELASELARTSRNQ
jgi:hypothetical protein